MAGQTLASGALHIAPQGRAKVLCVLCHGRGQSPEEMQAHILARLQCDAVAFVLPRAPRGSWYDAKAIDPLTEATRAQLAQSIAHLAADVASARALYPEIPLVLAGFSQGACLTLEYAFTGEAPNAAIVALTGCRVGRPQDSRPAALPPHLQVYLSGADADPWIPILAFAEAAHELGRARAHMRAEVIPDRKHEVSAPEIAAFGDLLARLSH